MKEREKKPAFLKSFSEFTIAELRAMPIRQLFSLFFREVSTTFRTGPMLKKTKQVYRAKKNVEKHILTAKIKPSFKMPVMHAPHLHVSTARFSEAMKRVFTPGPYKMTMSRKKQITRKTEKNGKSETVVFSKTTSIH